MPVRVLMTAAPPVNNIAVTRMLVIMPKTVKTLGRVSDHGLYSNCGDTRDLQMSRSSKSCFNDLEESVGIGSASLELNCNTSEEQDLDGGTRSVPERTRNPVLVSHGGALQEGSGPRPGRHDGRSHQT